MSMDVTVERERNVNRETEQSYVSYRTIVKSIRQGVQRSSSFG